MKTKLTLLLLTVTLSLGALPVSAGGPLIIWDAATQTPFAYFPGTVSVYTDLGGFGPLTNAEADVLTANGFAEWSAVPSSYFDAAVVGDVSTVGLPDITGATAGMVVGTFNGGGIHVMYDDDGSITSGFFGAPPGVLGIASPDFGDFGTGEITESWAMVNGLAVDPADLAPIPGASFGGVFTHEFGHAINLAHTQTNGAVAFFGDATAPAGCPAPYPFTITFDDVETMYPFLDPSAGSIGINMSTITQLDDIASVSNVYPTGGWPDPARSISGTIFAGDGVTELTGVNVIARNLADPFNDAISALSGDFTQGALGPDGRYTFNGLTPGADYVIYVDQIVAGGFSTTPIFLPASEEWYNGADESANPSIDDRCAFSTVSGGSSGIDVIFNDDGSLDLGDDDFEEVALPFAFNFCGTDYNSVFVGSNGFVTFGAGDTDFTESIADFIDSPPRIAPLWDDLSPNQGGAVFAEDVGGAFEVRWVDVPEFIQGNINTFTLTLRPDGTFNMDYGQIDAPDGLVGASPGALATDPGEIDVTAAPQPITGAPRDAVYELFSASDNDLGGANLEWAACPGFEILIDNAVENTCYASTGRFQGELLTIDITTGAGSLIGSTGLDGMSGLAINSAGEIYGTERVSGDLYRVDASTGQAFFVATTNVSFLDGIAFDENDVLYGVGFDPPAFNLRTIDVTTGATSVVGPTGDIYVGLTYDSTDGFLYASVGGFQPINPDGIARIDKNTGATTVLGTTGFGGATPDLHAVGGVLYAAKGGGQSATNNLIQVSKVDGSGTLVGPIGFSRVSGMAYFAGAGDVTPPELTIELDRDVLWPPNHKLVEVCVTVTAVDDTDPNPVISLISVVSDEPDNGTGDGDTPNDIVIVSDTKFQLRSERSGEGDGRKYTITYSATDASGNTTTEEACVYVPHDQSGNALAAGGFTQAGLETEVASFSLVIPSDETFDATRVIPDRAYVGNQSGVVRPSQSEEVDVDGDSRLDLLLTYPTAEFLSLIEVDPGSRITVGLHYTTSNNGNYLVKDLFTVQSIADISRERRPEEEIADGSVGTSGQEYGMLFAGEWVEVDVFTVTGRKVRSFARLGMPVDDPSLGWDGRDAGGRPVSGGIYFYRITTPTEVIKRKLVVVR